MQFIIIQAYYSTIVVLDILVVVLNKFNPYLLCTLACVCKTAYLLLLKHMQRRHLNMPVANICCIQVHLFNATALPLSRI